MTTKPSDSDEQPTIQESESPVSESGCSVVLGLLKIRGFRYVFISVGILVFGFEMRSVAQSWLTLELTDSQAWRGLVNGVSALGVIGALGVGMIPVYLYLTSKKFRAIT